MTTRTRTVEHVGEWRVSMVADSAEDLFAEVARILSRSCGRATVSTPGPWERVSVEARDVATLLADWANELIGRSEVCGASYGDIRELRLVHEPDGVTVSAEIRGRLVRSWTSPIKAATYHGLSVASAGGRWSATMLFDV